MKKRILLILTIVFAVTAAFVLAACNNTPSLLDFEEFKLAFEAEKYTVTLSDTSGLQSLIALSLPDNEFWLFRHSNGEQADAGWEIAKNYVELMKAEGKTLTAHRNVLNCNCGDLLQKQDCTFEGDCEFGMYVWYGTADAVAIFNTVKFPLDA